MKLIFSAILICFFSGFAQSQQTYRPGELKTSWGSEVTAANAWKEYPRPQLVRSEWKNLNGMWDYAIKPKGEKKPNSFDGQILVPFCVESSLSGVGKMVKPDQELWYKTSFTVPSNWQNKKLLLHFDAVDWETTVWINGKKAGYHKGGSDPFTIDISNHLKKGNQEIVISVWDPTDTGMQARGKQVLEPKGIWYTPVTGIWQTVWLEPVEKTFIKSIVPEANIDEGKVVVRNKIEGSSGKEVLSVKVLNAGKVISTTSAAANKDIVISLPNAELWTPEHPTLYQLEIDLKSGDKTIDKVKSYFAMRKISVGKDEFGYQRLLLNNKPVFQYGTLDQGWWPDGLLTPPSDKAMRFDIDMLKYMGFNMLRKHIKVEPSRYYYYADSIGLLVWQDMPSGFQSSEMATQYV
ncbi:MAG: glycoside hydrolase family 2 protein, partial [Sphingobacteriaceae bacterium]